MKWFVLVLVLVSAAVAQAAPDSLVPVINGSDFEQGGGGWSWSATGGVQATIRAETKDPRSGSGCLVLTNKTGVAPNVYARLLQNVIVLPEQEYELSVWVRGVDVSGEGGANHLTDWGTYGLNLPTGTFGWQKVSTVFKTKPGQRTVQLGLNIINKCKELAIDDIALLPIGTRLQGEGVNGSFIASPRVIGHNSSGSLLVLATSARPGMIVEASVRGVFKKSAPLKPGDNRLEWTWQSGTVPFGKLECSVRLLDGGKTVASGTREVEKVDSPVSSEIDRAEERMKEFNRLYAECKAKGVPLDYPNVTRMLLEQFIPLTREDVQKGQDWRAQGAVKDFHRSLDDSLAWMRFYLNRPEIAPNAVRYRTSRMAIHGTSFIADRKDSKGVQSRGPVFFCGYGHFGQVRKDTWRWPDYGVNIIQVECGPSLVLKSENQADLQYVRDLIKLLNEAAKLNVKVNILLSPHYFPGWAYEKWPHLSKGGGGFYGYTVDEPEAKQVIERYLRIVVPMLKDKPALHSFCLSNEPSFERAVSARNTKPMWEAYLLHIHGTVEQMNARYGTSYKAFADVPIPGWQAYGEHQYYDYVTFLQERFAGWHKWMADVVHDLAPNVPVHTKFRGHEIFYRPSIDWGIDPELFGHAMDINGDDCIFTGWPGEGWAGHWQLQNMAYDLQRSFADKPVLNSENHPTLDRSTDYIAPGHFRTALWQGAIHGQGATTIWVWERSHDPASDFYGNVMDRPGCAEQVGLTCLDLNRFAAEVTALQRVKAPVAIAFSMASVARDSVFLDAVQRVYTALNFCGVKVDFISEKQLAEGKGSQYGVIVLPHIGCVLPATFQAVKNLPSSVKLVFVGDCLVKDPYGKAYPANELKALRDRSTCLPDGDPKDVLWPVLYQLCRESSREKDPPVLSAPVNDGVYRRAVPRENWLMVNGQWLMANGIEPRTPSPVHGMERERAEVRAIRGTAHSTLRQSQDSWQAGGSFSDSRQEVVLVVDAATGGPVWGVEWLVAQSGSRTIVNMVNLRNKPVRVRVLRDRQPADARDLLSLGGQSPIGLLQPFAPALADIR